MYIGNGITNIRDLKPENIVYVNEATAYIKIIDFGQSKILRQNQPIKDVVGSLYYIAPEVLSSEEYDEKCDCWSCGVILYLLLAGFPPFYGHSREEIITAAAKGKVEFYHPNWNKVSSMAKELIISLLKYNPKERISISEALRHPWVCKYGIQHSISSSELKKVFMNMKNFRIQMLFQRSVLSYLASQRIKFEEESTMKRIFTFLDYDKDGYLSKKDLINGFSKIVKDVDKLTKDVDLIVSNVAMESSVTISYNEFLVANLNVDLIINQTNLRKAFEFFDQVALKY